MANVKYRQVKAFLLAAESGSFAQAAEQLCVTAPSLTALIQDLERYFGLRLFDRSTRKVTLTAAGQEFYDRVRQPVLGVEEAYQNMQDLAAVRRGEIVMGSLYSAAITLLPAALRGLAQQRPSLRVQVVEAYNDELIRLLRTNQIEFAVSAYVPSLSDMTFELLMADSFVAVFSDRHSDLPDPLGWTDLVGRDVVLTTRGSAPRALFENAVRDHLGAPTSIFEVTHMGTALRLAQEGLGVAILSRLSLSQLNMGALTSRPLSDPSSARQIGILRRNDRSLSPAAEAFIDQLTRVVATLP